MVKQKLQEDKQLVTVDGLEMGSCFRYEGCIWMKLRAQAVNLENGSFLPPYISDELVIPVIAHVEWRYFHVKKEIPAEVE